MMILEGFMFYLCLSQFHTYPVTFQSVLIDYEIKKNINTLYKKCIVLDPRAYVSNAVFIVFKGMQYTGITNVTKYST